MLREGGLRCCELRDVYQAPGYSSGCRTMRGAARTPTDLAVGEGHGAEQGRAGLVGPRRGADSIPPRFYSCPRALTRTDVGDTGEPAPARLTLGRCFLSSHQACLAAPTVWDTGVISTHSWGAPGKRTPVTAQPIIAPRSPLGAALWDAAGTGEHREGIRCAGSRARCPTVGIPRGVLHSIPTKRPQNSGDQDWGMGLKLPLNWQPEGWSDLEGWSCGGAGAARQAPQPECLRDTLKQEPETRSMSEFGSSACAFLF